MTTTDPCGTLHGASGMSAARRSADRNPFDTQQKPKAMQKSSDYAAPRIETLEVTAEQGFALSNLSTEDYTETPGQWNAAL